MSFPAHFAIVRALSSLHLSHFPLREAYESTLALLGRNLAHFYQMYGSSKAALLQVFEVEDLESDPLERRSSSRYVSFNGQATHGQTLKLLILT